ncbi:MAG TPA: preprotein translocase subunit SecE [Longimicrobiaceae bacterium]|nr:preprotein translocase subunit SecE [Longimicrobiaceae bacterium]
MAETTRNTAFDFAREVRDEVKKVSWPDRAQLKESTVVIVAFVAIVAFLIFLIDLGVRGALSLVQSLFGG